MKGVRLLGSYATVLFEVVSVRGDRHGLKIFPSQDVELIRSILSQSDKNADEARVRRLNGSAYDLTRAFELHVYEVANIKLP